MKKIIISGILLVAIIGVVLNFKRNENNKVLEELHTYYLASDKETITIYNKDFKEIDELYRGTEVKGYKTKIINKENNKEYIKIKLNEKEYLVSTDNIVENYQESIKETEKYVRTTTTVYEENSSKILGLVKKGEKVEIVGFDKLESGFAHRYKIVYNETAGFVYSKYLVDTKEEADKHYDEEGIYQIHATRGNSQGGGEAGSLDFYPYEKANFKENIMPEEVRSLYLNAGVLKNIDSYIELAKNSNINAFVVDIKDNTSPGYESEVMNLYSKTNYNHALNTFDEYKNVITKLKENGFYVIGRITVFKDSYYVTDHPESAIAGTNGEPLSHNGSYWPSAYDRGVWEFNVELAKEAVKEMGFNEIQFDYVRFPDRTNSLENTGKINMKNIYNETKAEAIQTFLMYACDQIHELKAYVSADVFGESAHHYVTGYGQYFGAISNIVDVISAMPYPDHFGAYEYGFSEIVWTVPYKLLYTWGSYAKERQTEIPTPAKVRTWIQAYDTVRAPYVIYNSEKISEEIKALKDAGLSGGYMTWNASSSLSKYTEIASAFKREY